jgi:hypothetical protein
MELSLIIIYGVIVLLCILVAIDQSRNQEHPTLGSEWDFTRTDLKAKSLDNTK